MKEQNLKKLYILIISILIIGIVFVFFIYVTNKNNHPFDPVLKMRSDSVKNYEVIDIKETDNGTIIYSVGKVNKDADNMYFVDMVEKSLIGYKWIGGGGHVNKDLGMNNNFIFSAQLLNEDQNITPTLIGIISDMKVSKITITTSSNKIYEGTIYDRNEEMEKFYYISFDENVANERFFIFTVIYEDGKVTEHTLSSKEDISKLQKGHQFYFNYN